MQFGSPAFRAANDLWPTRPHYGYGMFEAARLASRLDYDRMTVIEFGVATGGGLLAMEQLAAAIEPMQNIKIDVVGFDSGAGLPPPRDYRDVPHFWGGGDYRMDQAALRAKLQRAQLVIGDVTETIKQFRPPAPIGFIAFDLDYYSSTVEAFKIFDLPFSSRLPRVFCYFDDIIYPEDAFLNPYVGEELAIREFNESHTAKICPIKALSHTKAYTTAWHDQMYMTHDFDHPQYTWSVRHRPSK
jgi:hypothetical protein